MRRLVLLAPLALTACSTAAPACPSGQEMFQGACVDPDERYEPAQRIDFDNVTQFGGPLTQLKLPDPPKSGFRVIAPPRTMMPGEEVEYCLAWPFPKFTNDVVYTGRLYTTKGLHHSNLISKPVDPTVGPNPYPNCNPGASDPFSRLPQVIPDVLFANSTQVVGEETLAFPPGKGYPVDPSHEIITDIHLLNTTADTEVVEVAYDFFTMPASDLVDEVAPFVLQVDNFDIPPHSTGVVGSSCAVFGGNVVEMMPHTHKLATAFTVDLIDELGTDKRVIDNGAFDSQSHIQMFEPELDLTTTASMAFQCTFANTTNQDVVYGIGQNEMCVLFGYLYPVRNQFVGHAPYQGMPCQSVEVGLFR
jgi:Copper type II ascorbate-dependent monooxygenase, C-terminal domain